MSTTVMQLYDVVPTGSLSSQRRHLCLYTPSDAMILHTLTLCGLNMGYYQVAERKDLRLELCANCRNIERVLKQVLAELGLELGESDGA